MHLATKTTVQFSLLAWVHKTGILSRSCLVFIHRMTEEDVKQLFKDIKTDSDGNIDYVRFVRVLKSGQESPGESDDQLKDLDEEEAL